MERDHQGDETLIVTAQGLLNRLRRVLGRSAAQAPATPIAATPAPPPADAPERWIDQLAEVWLADRRGRGRLYADLPDGRIDMLEARFPAQVEKTIAAAERALRHEFDLLGSGNVVPVDAARPKTADGYQPIDWALDPAAGVSFRTDFRAADWKPAMRPGMADVKWPWEIGRCQHWIALGQAYRFTGDERYALEIVRQQADFIEQNPVGFGIQYVVTMDVAIRAFNWALAFELIRESAAFQGAVVRRAYEALFDTGVFIERHLENKYEVTSNHFLSNVAGLYALGIVFADLPAGARWLRQGRDWFEQEMKVQVLDDGADYESSVPYHRLVLELFLAGARLAERDGAPMSEAYRASLRRMSEFMATVLRPDGLMPQIGDADDGRLHIFTDYGTWQPQDGRHILAPAACMFGEPSWLAISGDAGLWEAAWWGYDIAAIASSDAPPPAAPRLFAHAGIAVAPTPNAYLLVTNSRVGTNGFGNHKHNDLLSFEFHADGIPLIVDPGSYLYTSKPDERNRFRSTAYHNTLQIDGVEQNDLKLDYLFRLFETSTVEHLQFEDGADHVEYRGRHTGYERLPSPVTHERTFHLAKRDGALTVTDRLRGAGEHSLRWHFHAAPGIAVEAGDGVVTLASSRGRWALSLDRAMQPIVSDAWYSPSYGVRVACRAIDIVVTADVSAASEFVFRITPVPSSSS